MIVLLAGLWPGLAVALLLGLGIGALAGWPQDRAIPLGLAAAAAGLGGVTASGLVAGPPGLWLESGALMLAAYAVGCALGGLARPGPDQA
ncbi:hypothetical protein [Methylobacterium radiodurans]|uniref:Uncharacterized protein n=1 Tax=Methylobacterium radiodurans TaxID=2202828 RepID=A0A2U8VQ18_9HYPH|nr:hypothetical protein [Methylobacterium radiodurans]AWN35723.1 hypothetical protein DK427_08185 [Methylobacterium radiodurans]